MTTLTLPRVHVQWPYDTINTPQLRSILLAKAYSSFYPDEMEATSSFSLMGGIASMLTNLVPPKFVDRDGQLQAAFIQAGMNLVVDPYHTEEEVLELLNYPKVIEFLDKFEGDNIILYRDHSDQQILMVGIILLTLGKNVNPDNYTGWIRNILRTFKGALGIMDDRCCWTEAQCPPQETLAASYTILSVSFGDTETHSKGLHLGCAKQ
jgi:hypothetical protein